MQENTQIEIHVAAAENKVTKVINSYGKKKTYHNGGFRIGVSIEGEGDFICITKSATYSGLAESWGVLRAVEWAIAQGIKDLKVCTVDHCASSRRKSGFFLNLAHAKAEVAGMKLDIERVGKEDNWAVDLARDQDAQFLPRVEDDTEEVKHAVAIVLKSYETRDGEVNPTAEQGMPELPVHKTEPGKIPPAAWQVIGLESLSSSDRVYLAALSLADDRTFVIVDESSYIKGHDSNRTLRATRIASQARYRFILTGTPITQGVVDLYAQFKFLDTRILGYKSFHAFEANHLEYSDKYPGMIVRSHNTAWLAAKIAPYTYQITKKECLPLPEKIHTTRYFTMTMEQRAAYEQAKQEAFEDIADDDDISGTVIFRLFTALQQIVCGFWNRRDPDDWDDQQVFEYEHDRVKQLAATIAEIPATERVIIFAKYRRDVRAIAEALGSDACCFYGDLKLDEREAELRRFRAGARYFVATQDCGGHGLTLNESCKVIFYNNQFKYANRLQAEDRNHRIGQTRDVTYIDLICSDSIDERIQRSLAKKADVVEEFKAEVARLRETRTFREAVKTAINQL